MVWYGNIYKVLEPFEQDAENENLNRKLDLPWK